MKQRRVLEAFLVLLATSGHYQAHAQEAGNSGQPRVIEITAKRFEFVPPQITLKKGAPVILRLHSADVKHGFYQREMKIDAEIPAGQSVDLTLTPSTAGIFTTKCDHFCGLGHGDMKMKIVVE